MQQYKVSCYAWKVNAFEVSNQHADQGQRLACRHAAVSIVTVRRLFIEPAQYHGLSNGNESVPDCMIGTHHARAITQCCELRLVVA